ncbi:winged helix DNA-binding domain-containing protein [Actinomadura parmotrematis]|uniref:Winged helix DNA-binding domain-containing protein n=1 Tax=Actinomadura parmotrematis TaxID=2864039 RepID=A0ABS7FYU2_9ACTN|nr:winged helix DNA-binding domain-containing protein [Actinomadura parmotrematis]MBW8485613.1 winged helix DNA-binding domain-containing protein [Actinomadura parmotrematis]
MSPARPKITDVQRRARLGRAHLLAASARVDGPEQVAERVLGLHATDPATVYLSAAARQRNPSAADLERALYDERTLVRMLCMRRTLFVVPAGLAPIVDASIGRPVAARERRMLLRDLSAQLGHGQDWLAAVEQQVLAVLADLGEATAAQLAGLVPALRTRLVRSPGKSYETRARITNRVLTLLAAEGRIRRGRPLGSWTSSRFRWTLAEPRPELPEADARAALAGRYLAAFGPATTRDVQWWTGWNLTDTRTAIAATGAMDVDLDHGPGHALPQHLDPAPEFEPWAALLPSLDPTAMGWRHRDWYLDHAHTGDLFDRNGNIGPTLWWNGRIIGGWAQRPDGRITTRLLAPDPGRDAQHAIDDAVQRLTAFLGPTRSRPSIRTPLERRLNA